MVNRKYTPKYDNDTVPLWYLEQQLNNSRLTGEIIIYGGKTLPEGWLPCDGRELSRTKYNNLYKTIGTFYGNGNGSTTFNLPDFYLGGDAPLESWLIKY